MANTNDKLNLIKVTNKILEEMRLRGFERIDRTKRSEHINEFSNRRNLK